MRILFIILTLLVVSTCSLQAQHKEKEQMKVAVWDTYVKKKDGKVMHFDIIVPASVKDTAVIYHYGRDYLKSKGQEGQTLASKECRFCHTRDIQPAWKADIGKKGYYILELENCN